MESYKDLKIIIKRSFKRRTVSLQIKKDSLRILAPYFLSDYSITKLIYKNHKWIDKKIKSQKKAPRQIEKKFKSGDCFSYLGEYYYLSKSKSNISNVNT